MSYEHTDSSEDYSFTYKIVVQCQNERSQYKNKEIRYKMLKADYMNMNYKKEMKKLKGSC